MGIKEESGKYLCSKQVLCEWQALWREDGAAGGVDDTVIHICQSNWKQGHADQGVCFDGERRAFHNRRPWVQTQKG